MSEDFQIIKSSGDENFLHLKFGASTGKFAKQVSLHDLIEYSGADVYFDINEKGELVGVEVLA